MKRAKSPSSKKRNDKIALLRRIYLQENTKAKRSRWSKKYQSSPKMMKNKKATVISMNKYQQSPGKRPATVGTTAIGLLESSEEDFPHWTFPEIEEAKNPRTREAFRKRKHEESIHLGKLMAELRSKTEEAEELRVENEQLLDIRRTDYVIPELRKKVSELSIDLRQKNKEVKELRKKNQEILKIKKDKEIVVEIKEDVEQDSVSTPESEELREELLTTTEEVKTLRTQVIELKEKNLDLLKELKWAKKNLELRNTLAKMEIQQLQANQARGLVQMSSLQHKLEEMRQEKELLSDLSFDHYTSD